MKEEAPTFNKEEEVIQEESNHSPEVYFEEEIINLDV